MDGTKRADREMLALFFMIQEVPPDFLYHKKYCGRKQDSFS